MAAKNVGLAQLLTFAGAKQKPRLTVADELNQQLRNVLREVYFTLSVFRLEIVVNFGGWPPFHTTQTNVVEFPGAALSPEARVRNDGAGGT